MALISHHLRSRGYRRPLVGVRVSTEGVFIVQKARLKPIPVHRSCNLIAPLARIGSHELVLATNTDHKVSVRRARTLYEKKQTAHIDVSTVPATTKLNYHARS